MNEYIKTEKARHNQKMIKLENTKKCIGMWRESAERGFSAELTNELWLLVVASAKDEWGQNTEADDFSIEGKVVISNGSKEIIL